MNNETNRSPADEQAIRAGKDMAHAVLFCAIIKHHPNREAVLNSIRQAHLRLPGIAAQDPRDQGDQTSASYVFQTYMEMIREMERTMPG
jgi:hypothetical protein